MDQASGVELGPNGAMNLSASDAACETRRKPAGNGKGTSSTSVGLEAGKGTGSTRAVSLRIGKGMSSLVPISDSFEDPASATEDFGDRKLENVPSASDRPPDLSS